MGGGGSFSQAYSREVEPHSKPQFPVLSLVSDAFLEWGPFSTYNSEAIPRSISGSTIYFLFSVPLTASCFCFISIFIWKSC